MNEIPENNETQSISVRFNPITPWVTWTLLALTILIFIAQEITKAVVGFDFPLSIGAKYGPLIMRGQYWRLVTPVLLHGGIAHLLFNMYALYVVGPTLEQFYGHVDFLLFYIITGFTGNVVSFIFAPTTVSVGASTAIFGMIVAQGLIIYKNKQLFPNPKKALMNILYIVILNLFLGLRAGIDNWGHVGGLIGGLLIAVLVGPNITVRFSESTREFILSDKVKKSFRLIIYALTVVVFSILAVFLSKRF